MEWRCEWCGKPHEENDPPCDNCGHGTFEQAVVQVPGGEAGSGGTTMWVCESCGRSHTKHNPPCSRCGHHKLERVHRSPEEYDVEAPGYRDLVTPKYLAGLAAVLGLAAVFVLGVTGIVPVPGLTQGGVPEVTDVPGSAEAAGGINLSAVETELTAVVDERRAAAGYPTLATDERLTAVATFYTQRLVKAEHGTGQLPPDSQLRDLLGDRCGDSNILLVPHRVDGDASVPSQASAGAAAQALADLFPTDGGPSESPGQGLQGLDVHVGPNGTTYVTQILC